MAHGALKDPVASASDVPRLAFWFTATSRQVRHLTAVPLSAPDRELGHLLTVAASRLGSQLLTAADVDELDDRLDDLVESHDLVNINSLMISGDGLAEAPSLDDVVDFHDAVMAAIGQEHGQRLVDASSLVQAWVSTQVAALTKLEEQHGIDIGDAHEAARAISLTDPEIPPEIAGAIVAARRATLVQLAFSHVVDEEVAVEPWLGAALVERFLTSVRKHFAFLAALVPDVSETFVSKTERLDLDEITSRHVHSRAVAKRTLEAARAHGGEGGRGAERAGPR